MNIAEKFEAESAGIDYMPHKVFQGVYLKHLVKSGATGGLVSCHLVKVEPFCALETHTHPEQLEIHEVLSGEGEGQIAGKQARYVPGAIEVIPKNTPHRVTAGKEGLYILATFTPASL